MKKYGIFYGSSTGTTKKVAEMIGNLLGVAEEDIMNVATVAPSKVADYEVLLLGTSTWGRGELQDDWYNYIAGLEEMDLAGKKIALFGCGDEKMKNTFCNGVGELYDRLGKSRATFVAPYDTIGYVFNKSKAKPEDALEAVGLLIDESNHADLTEKRVKGWTDLLKRSVE